MISIESITGISIDRLKEMYGKFGEVIGMNLLGTGGPEVEMTMEVSLPEMLVGLGVAKDEKEGDRFLKVLITGALMRNREGGMEGMVGTFGDLMKTGYLIGLAAGKVKVEGVGVN